MTSIPREPVLHPTPILSLRPTQITLGMHEVDRKQEAWKTKTSQDLEKFLGSHMVPTILGLDGEHFLIDHHHLARALYEEGVKSVFVTVVADLRRLPESHFWNFLDFHGWAHPYDPKGRRRPYSDLPRTVKAWRTIPIARSPGNCATSAVSPRIRRRFRVLLGRLPASAHQGQGDQGGF
jgi:hypothetical protein